MWLKDKLLNLHTEVFILQYYNEHFVMWVFIELTGILQSKKLNTGKLKMVAKRLIPMIKYNSRLKLWNYFFWTIQVVFMYVLMMSFCGILINFCEFINKRRGLFYIDQTCTIKFVSMFESVLVRLVHVCRWKLKTLQKRHKDM